VQLVAAGSSENCFESLLTVSSQLLAVNPSLLLYITVICRYFHYFGKILWLIALTVQNSGENTDPKKTALLTTIVVGRFFLFRYLLPLLRFIAKYHRRYFANVLRFRLSGFPNCLSDNVPLRTSVSVLGIVDCGSTQTFENSGTDPRTSSKRSCTSL